MQKFTEPIKCEISNNGKSIKLLESFVYFRKDLELQDIIVPKDFQSDGFTSLVFEFLIPRFGKGLKCAILHDFLCENFHKGINTRKYADEVFLESMLEVKAFSKLKSYLIYSFVRIFAFLKNYK